MTTFDNKAYEASDRNENQVKNSVYSDNESCKENRFTNLNDEEIRSMKRGKSQPPLFKLDIMTNSNEITTFDNKGNEAADGNGNQVKNPVYSDKESCKENRFANLNDEEICSMKRGIYKNLLTISIAFMLLFTAFESMASLQSSINKVGKAELAQVGYIFPAHISALASKMGQIKKN